MQTAFKFDACTFSPVLAEEAKQEGRDAASRSRGELLTAVRSALRGIALSRPSRTATADDGQDWLIRAGHQPSDLGNAAGAMFDRKSWEFTGQWTKSQRVSSHANDIRIWRLK